MVARVYHFFESFWFIHVQICYFGQVLLYEVVTLYMPPLISILPSKQLKISFRHCAARNKLGFFDASSHLEVSLYEGVTVRPSVRP